MGENVSLGNTTSNVSNYDRKQTRGKRYRLQNMARELLEGWRVGWCMRSMKGNTVAVRHSGEHGHAYYEGVQVCGSVWTCPVCSAKITETRRQELRGASEVENFTPVLVTVTLQHERDDRLKELLTALNDSLRRLKQGRFWKDTRERWHIEAYVSALEVTWGYDAGWHPHKHWLLFLDLPEDEIDSQELQEHLTAQYKKLLARHGRYASDYYGINVQVGNRHAKDYATKWGVIEEVTKAPVKAGKKGFSPFQLLDLADQGEEWAGWLFVEYAEATKGKRQLAWSHGARDILGLGAELTDEDLADHPEGDLEEDVTLLWLGREQWHYIVTHRLRAKLLDVADSGDLYEVLKFLIGVGCPLESYAWAYERASV